MNQMEKQEKNLVKSAKDFVREKNGGLSSRIRMKLDNIKPAVSVLITERMSIKDIQEFIQRETGLKISLVPLRQYCKDTFNYQE